MQNNMTSIENSIHRCSVQGPANQPVNTIPEPANAWQAPGTKRRSHTVRPRHGPCAPMSDSAPSERRSLWAAAPEPRDELGLATMMWLLLLGAAAGLTAFALLALQTTLDRSGDQTGNISAVSVSAPHAAAAVVFDAKHSSPGDFETWSDWETHYRGLCASVEVRFSNHGAELVAIAFNRAAGGTDFDTSAAEHVASADARPPTLTKAQVQCIVR